MNAIPKLQSPALTNFKYIELSPEDQLSFDAWSTHSRYCSYFVLRTENNMGYMGDWDAPFFSIEELNEFARNILMVHPELEDQLSWTFGNITVRILESQPQNFYWQLWHQKHRERIAKLEQVQKERAERHAKSKIELLKRIEYAKNDSSYCYHLSVFRKGHEVYPFGLNQTPYFSLEEAEQAYQRNQLIYSGEEFYIGFGSMDIDCLLAADGNVKEAEQKWIDQHKLRIQALNTMVAS